MNVGLDGLGIGPFSLNWQNLTLALGLITWFALARFREAERTALLTLVVARLWATLPGLDVNRPFLENVLDVLDLRRGTWAWGPGLAAGGLFLAVLVQQRKITARHVTSVLALTLLVAILPGLLKPAPESAQAALPAQALPRLSAGQVLAAEALPKGSILNFWASWCGPCRAELPLLAGWAARGEPIQLVNVGESSETVTAFLSGEKLKLNTWLAGEKLTGPLGISGFPTTIVVNAQGRIIARHLGPLTAAQLRNMVKLLQGDS